MDGGPRVRAPERAPSGRPVPHRTDEGPVRDPARGCGGSRGGPLPEVAVLGNPRHRRGRNPRRGPPPAPPPAADVGTARAASTPLTDPPGSTGKGPGSDDTS